MNETTEKNKTRTINDYKLKPKEDEIVGILLKYGKSMTISDIQKKTKMSWNTIKNYITKSLEPKGILTKEEWNGQEYWLLNY